jgi:hypothetical protein
MRPRREWVGAALPPAEHVEEAAEAGRDPAEAGGNKETAADLSSAGPKG